MKVLNLFENNAKKLQQARNILAENGIDCAIEELQQLAKLDQIVHDKQLDFQSKQLIQQITELESLHQKTIQKIQGFVTFELPSFSTILVDDRLITLSGYSKATWHSSPNFIATILHPDFEKYYYSKIEEMKRGILPKVMEYKIISKEGNEHWWLQFNIGAYNIDGQLDTISSIIVDNTEKKLAELKLQQSEEKFRSIVEQSVAGIMIFENNQIVFSNDIIFQQSGFTRDQMDSIQFSDLCKFIHPDDIATVLEHYDSAKKIGHTPEFYCRIIGPNKDIIWLSCQFKKMIYDGADAIAAIMVEVTKRAELEQKLLIERKLAQKFFDITRSILIILDTKGNITQINNSACEILKVTEEEALGLNWVQNFIPREFRDHVKDILTTALQEDIDSEESYINYVLAQDGSQPLISFNYTVFHDNQGNVSSIIGSGEDISDHIDAKQRFLNCKSSK